MTTKGTSSNQLEIIGRLMATQDKNSNPFEIIDGQVILHDEIRGFDKTVLNYEQVGAIKLLLEGLKNGEI
mgnify:CR=1 FL=1